MVPDTPSYLVLGPVMALDERGQAIDLGPAQRRAVLAQLALAPGRTISVDAISDGLWGSAPPATSVKSIQVHVSKLRPHLPADALVTRPPGYALQVPLDAIDAGRFEAEATLGAQLLAGGRPEPAAEVLRTALARWRGPALADMRTFPFAAAAVASLEEARQQAEEDRAEAELALGRHAALVAELEAMVRAEPLRERRWGQLMTALYRCDRQAEALDAYRRAREHLVEHLGLEPGAELQRLEREVLEHSLPAALPPGRSAVPGTGTGAGTGTRGGTSALGRPRAAALRPSGPVVGRAEPLAQLDEAMRRATSAEGGIVAVRGDEGFGKTTLMAAFAASVDGRCLVLAGRCREHVSIPFGPWAEVLHQLGAEPVLDLLESTAPNQEAPERRRALLLEAVVSALAVVSRDRPVVVVLDDLQWSDDASVALLLHAVDQLSSSAVLFVTAWRDREVTMGHPVSRLVHHVTRAGAPAIDLAPLLSADIAELLVHADLPAEPVRLRRVASVIHRATSGVPLFVTDVVATLDATHDELPSPDDIAPAIPETARTLVAGRLATAGDGAGAVAEAAAVLTDPFDAALVHALVPERSLGEVLRSLDSLVDAGLLQEAPVGYGFTHAAFRHAIDSSMRAGRRQTLHASAFRALERMPIPPAVLAHHAESAGALVPRQDVLQQLERAGRDAVARGAFVDAAQFLGRAVDHTDPDAGARAPAMVAHADALWRAGDITAAKAVAAEVLADAGDPTLPDRVLADAAVIHCWFGAGFGVDRSSIAAAEAALRVVTDPLARARLLVAEAFQHATWGSPMPVALDAVATAKAALPDPCPPEVLADALLAESQAILGTADLARRERVADELLDLGRSTSSLRDVGRALRMRSLVEMSAGRLRALDVTLDELLDVAERLGSWLYRSDAWRWRVAASMARGDDEAVAVALDELDRAAASPFAGRAFVGTQRVLKLRADGELDTCLSLVEGLRATLPDDRQLAPDRRLVDLFRLVVLTEVGRDDEARDELLRLAPHEGTELTPSRHLTVELAYTAHLVATLGLADLAPALLTRLEPYRGQLLVLSWGEAILGAADRYLAELTTLVTGVVDEGSFQEAADLEEEAGAVVEAERTRLAWRQAAARTGSRPRP